MHVWIRRPSFVLTAKTRDDRGCKLTLLGITFHRIDGMQQSIALSYLVFHCGYDDAKMVQPCRVYVLEGVRLCWHRFSLCRTHSFGRDFSLEWRNLAIKHSILCLALWSNQWSETGLLYQHIWVRNAWFVFAEFCFGCVAHTVPLSWPRLHGFYPLTLLVCIRANKLFDCWVSVSHTAKEGYLSRHSHGEKLHITEGKRGGEMGTGLY